MRTFFLDIASHQGLLACIEDDVVRSSVSVDTKVSDAELPALIEKCWNDARWSSKDIQQIACVIGPGGFMSLRVAVAAANTLSWALGVPSTGIYLSDLYSARSSKKDAFWIHSTKKQEVFVRDWKAGELENSSMQHLTLEKLRELLSEGSTWMGELIPEHRALMTEWKMNEASLKSIEEILPSFLNTLTYERQTLQPWYGREG